MSMFNEILDVEERDLKQAITYGSDDDSYSKQFLQLRLLRSELGVNGIGLLHYRTAVQDEEDKVNKSAEYETGHDEVYVTERKDIRRKYSPDSRHEEQDK